MGGQEDSGTVQEEGRAVHAPAPDPKPTEPLKLTTQSEQICGLEGGKAERAPAPGQVLFNYLTISSCSFLSG